jgi:hypothetical protein
MLTLISFLFLTPAHAQGVLTGVSPQLSAGTFDVYMQLGGGSTGSTGVAPGTWWFVPHAVENELGKTYTEACIHVASAGAAGSTIDLAIFDSDASGLPENEITLISGAFDNTVSNAYQCVTIPGGLTVNVLVPVWLALNKSAGATSNNLYTVAAASTRSLGANPDLRGAPTTGLSLADIDYADPIDPADLAAKTGQAILIGLR